MGETEFFKNNYFLERDKIEKKGCIKGDFPLINLLESQQLSKITRVGLTHRNLLSIFHC